MEKWSIRETCLFAIKALEDLGKAFDKVFKEIEDNSNMPEMRAKVKATTVVPFDGGERIIFDAVCKNEYGSTGLDEDNTYAKFTPAATFDITITNPALVGKYKQGKEYYVDFIPV